MDDQHTSERGAAKSPRQTAVDLYDAAVKAVEPEAVTTRAMDSLRLPPAGRVWILAFGKASSAMAQAAVASLQRSRSFVAGGIIVSKEPARAPLAVITAMQGDHPIPGRQSFAAAEAIAQVSGAKRSNEVCLVLVSGGTSSLIAAPLRGMAESDLSDLYEMLLGSGLDIHAMNAIRKRFSRWAAGRLAQALAPSATHCLAISDVPGDELEVIGSGPCVPDPTRASEVWDLLKKARLDTKISATQRDYLRSVMQGTSPETLKRGHPAFAHVSARVIGSNALALDGASRRARELGFAAQIASEPLDGEASAMGQRVARRLIDAKAKQERGPGCILWGGETTVTLTTGQDQHAGGRSQELALAAARELDAAGDAAEGIVLLAAGTDGRDGATDAAGAVVDRSTWSAISTAGQDAAAALAQHASTAALASAGAGVLIPAHPTGTNVSDIAIGIFT